MRSIDVARPAALCFVLSLACVNGAGAQPICSVTVPGQNDPAVDVAAVAAAVNSPTASGDVTVCLAGTFDFGLVVPPNLQSFSIVPSAAVSSLRIVGLNDANGRKATIRNGVQPIALAPGAVVPRFEVENLRFVSPALSAISLLRANGFVRIADVHVAGVRSLFLGPVSFREGIAVTAALAPINGEIVIENNVVDGGVYSPADTVLSVSAGVVLSGAIPGTSQPFAARVKVSGNRIVNWSGVGILATGIADATIEDNRIHPGIFANTVPGCAATNSMGAASGISFGSVTDSLVRDNVVELVPALTGSGAAPVCTAGLIVTGVVTTGADGNIFFDNRIRGTGNYAIVVGTAPLSTETDNLFALNRTQNFVPTSALLSLGPGATDNVLIGDFTTIEGNSAANTILNR